MPQTNSINKQAVLPTAYLVQSRSREIGWYHDRIALKFGGSLGNAAAEAPVKFQIDWKSLNANLAVLRLHEDLR